MSKYEIYETVYEETMIKRIDDDGTIWTFGQDENNADYQKYLLDIVEK